MSACERPTCEQVGATDFSASGTTHKAAHEFKLNLALGDIVLYSVDRVFDLFVYKPADDSPTKAVLYEGKVEVCTTSSDKDYQRWGIEDTLKGTSATILYADIENDVYLIKEVVDDSHVIMASTQIVPYHVGFGTAKSVAFSTAKRSKVSTRHYLSIRGRVVYESKPSLIVTPPTNLIPIMWPVPPSTAAFFLGDPKYAWIETTGFYNYNDPADIGFAPCVDRISGGGEGILTGYSLALSDGGKDFFYPDWVRNGFMQGSKIHDLWAFEADKRFYNMLGGPVSAECAKPYTLDYNIPLTISSEPVGNYVRYGEQDFYSFYLPEIHQTIKSLGSTDMTTAFETYYKEVFKNTSKREYSPAQDGDIVHHPVGFAL